ASKIRVYHDNRKAHLDDIKERVLVPLKDSLTQYGVLVSHKSPVVAHGWGTRARSAKLSVTEYPTQDGPILTKIAPDIRAATDPALYMDAKQRHFPRIVRNAEDFLTSWQTHVDACYVWVQGLSQEILDKSQLPEHSGAIVPAYIMHYRLGVFVYRRLFNSLDR